MKHLALIPVVELLKALDAGQVLLLLQGEGLALKLGLAAVEHQLHDHGPVDAQHLGLGVLLARGAHLHAADQGVVLGVLGGDAHLLLGLDAGAVIEERGEADAGLDEGHALRPHSLGHVVIIAQRDQRLVEAQTAGGLQNDIGHGVGREFAVLVHAAHGDILIGVQVGAELDPQGINIVAGLLIGQDTGLHIPLIEGI